MLSEIFSNVLLMKFAGVVVATLGRVVTFEVSFNELVVFSTLALTKLMIKTIKVNSSLMASKLFCTIHRFLSSFLLLF